MEKSKSQCLGAFDLRQVLLMSKKITAFEKGRLILFDLFRDLRGLLNAIEFNWNDWKDAVQREVNNLELIYDDLMDEEINVETCIKNLNFLTKSILDDYLKVPDSNIAEKAIAEGPDWLICPKCHEAWQSDSLFAMVVCPQCESALHNPRKS